MVDRGLKAYANLLNFGFLVGQQPLTRTLPANAAKARAYIVIFLTTISWTAFQVYLSMASCTYRSSTEQPVLYRIHAPFGVTPFRSTPLMDGREWPHFGPHRRLSYAVSVVRASRRFQARLSLHRPL